MMKLKRFLAIMLTLVMLATVVSASFTVFASDCNCENIPVIYIKGRTNIYKTTDDISEGNLAETNFSGGDDSIKDAAVNIISALAVALATDEWDEYCDVLYEEIIPVYDQYKLNNDGEIDNESGIDPQWNVENRIAQAKAEGRNGHIAYANDAWHYQFQYDMRLDPLVNAADLAQYIDAVREISGHDKVAITARCEGTVIANAYFHLYGYEKVAKYINYNGISAGSEIADDVYSNKVTIDPEGLNSFINTFVDSTPVLEFVKATVNLAVFNGLLGSGIGVVENIYDKVSANLMPRLIRDIFGTCPGWWGMVSPEAFEECKAFVLGDNADGKYDKLIEKIDNYNYNYKVTVREKLEEMQANGVEVYVLAKYNSQMYPVIERSDILGDGVVSVYKQTFEGATTSKYKGKLDETYIAERTQAGYGDFISADSMVDASTAPFKEHTWYFKELDHHVYPKAVDSFMLQILRHKDYVDIYTFSEWPQFTHFEAAGEDEWGSELFTITPLTAENADNTKDTTNTDSIFAVLFGWIKSFIALIVSLFKK